MSRSEAVGEEFPNCAFDDARLEFQPVKFLKQIPCGLLGKRSDSGWRSL